jgi:hypothetical protein
MNLDLNTVTRNLRDAIISIDLGCYEGLAIADTLSSLARFYLDAAKRANPDTFYGYGPEQDAIRALERNIQQLENMVASHKYIQASQPVYTERPEWLGPINTGVLS